MDGEAVNRIADLAQSNIETHEGQLFHVTHKSAKPLEFNILESLRVFSLEQLISCLEVRSQAEEKGAIIVNIESPTKVFATVGLNENKSYDRLCEADFEKNISPFKGGEYYSQSDFILQLLTKFQATDSRADLIKMVSSVKAEKILASDDDGFSQVVAAKAGVHLSAEVKLPNLFKLKTYKTFPEVDQPEIYYILRLNQRDSEMPRFALFECDGGQWRVETTVKIREFLQTRTQDLPNVKIL